MEFYDVIHSRRSVRIYKQDAIPGGALKRILEAYRAAPSWANRQPWELALVTDPTIKKELQQTISQGNPASAAVLDAPMVVCAIGIYGQSGYYKGVPVTGRGDWAMFDAALALEHLALAATAEGLGTVHVGYFDYEKAGQILQLPPDRTVFELVPLGYPAHEPRPVPRKALEEFVFHNRHGQKFFS